MYHEAFIIHHSGMRNYRGRGEARGLWGLGKKKPTGTRKGRYNPERTRLLLFLRVRTEMIDVQFVQ